MPIETIILDLDETLIHSETNAKVMANPDFTFVIAGEKYYVRKRPGLDKFLAYVFSHFKTVGVWTAATKDYANKIVNNIFTPEQKAQLKYFMSRKHIIDGQKPLQRIFDQAGDAKGINNKQGETCTTCTKYNTIMIDDNPDVLSNNPGNAIQVPQWLGKGKDDYLFKLIIVLQSILDLKVSVNTDHGIIKLTDITDYTE